MTRGYTPQELLEAARSRTLGKVHAPVGTDVPVKGDGGCDIALICAAAKGNLNQVRDLVEQQADLDGVDHDGKTALIWAAMHNHVHVVRYLVECGANVNLKDQWGSTALLKAPVDGSLEIMQCLADAGADMSASRENMYAPLQEAAKLGNLDMVQFLVSAGADVEMRNLLGDTPITTATKKRNTRVVQYLADAGADVNVINRYEEVPLTHAVGYYRLDLVQILVEHGADVNAHDPSGYSILMRAAAWGTFQIVEYLVEQGAKVNVSSTQGCTALMRAARCHRVDIVQFLIDNGANVNAINNQGCSALIRATEGDPSEDMLNTLRLLAEHGANVSAVDGHGRTALLRIAAKNHFDELLQFMIDQGADVNVADNDGKSPLQEASKHGHLENIHYLVKNGAVVNAANNEGRTALMQAVDKCHIEAAQFLLENDSDLHMKDLSGQTAMSIATARGYREIELLLARYIFQIHEEKNFTSATANLKIRQSSKWFISPLDVEIKQFINTESIGGEFLAKWLDADVTVKLFVPDASNASFTEEIVMWRELWHPHVIKLFGACDIGHHFFVCEYASNGSALEYLARVDDSRRTPWRILYQAALGLAFLHERKSVHGNLRGINILIGSDGVAKLANFGLSGSTRHVDASTPRGDAVSIGWQACEVLEGGKPTFASDIFSLGMCVMEVVKGTLPWSRLAYSEISRSRLQRAHRLIRPRLGEPGLRTENFRTLIDRMCCKDPSARESAVSCVRLLEVFAIEEEGMILKQDSALNPEPLVTIDEYQDNVALKLWDTLRTNAKRFTENDIHYRLYEDLETLLSTIQQSPRSIKLLAQFHELLEDATRATSEDRSYVNGVLQLLSSRATRNSLYGFQRRVDTLRAQLNLLPRDLNERALEHESKQLKHTELFVSKASKSWIILSELRQSKDQMAFLELLQSEINDHAANYTLTQLGMMQKAYDEIDSKLHERILKTTPAWFIPWYELPNNEWKQLGEKGRSKVFRTKWLNFDVVVKCLDYGNAQREEDRKVLAQELGIWSSLHHPHIVRLFGASHIGKPFLVCEHAPNGVLVDYLVKHPDQIWHKLHEAALGLLYLHERGIIHGNLKCNNIVVGIDDKAKLTDVGLSSTTTAAPTTENAMHTSGAWHWAAPELLIIPNTMATFESDVYSFGMSIIEALRAIETVKTPSDFEKSRLLALPWISNGLPLSKGAAQAHKKQGKLPSRPRVCTDEEWTLVEKMCRLEPSERIQTCTVVEELAKLCEGRNVHHKLEVEPAETVIRAMALRFENSASSHGRSRFHDVLHHVYKLLWMRLAELQGRYVCNNAALDELAADAKLASLDAADPSKLSLVRFTELACRSYGLHRRVDKWMAAALIRTSGEAAGVHDWRSRCYGFLGVSTA